MFGTGAPGLRAKNGVGELDSNCSFDSCTVPATIHDAGAGERALATTTREQAVAAYSYYSY